MSHSCAVRPASIRINPARWDSSWPALAGVHERERLLGWLEQRFGIPAATFAAYGFFRRQRSWFMVPASPLLERVAALKIKRLGLRAFQEVGAYIKPTTRFIQLYGRLATRARVALDGRALKRLLAGERLLLDIPEGDGYVILAAEDGAVWGFGLLLRGALQSQLPRREVRTLTLPTAES